VRFLQSTPSQAVSIIKNGIFRKLAELGSLDPLRKTLRRREDR
jgi:hypothetical protein